MPNRQLTAHELKNLARPLLAEVEQRLRVFAAGDADVPQGTIHEEHEG